MQTMADLKRRWGRASPALKAIIPEQLNGILHISSYLLIAEKNRKDTIYIPLDGILDKQSQTVPFPLTRAGSLSGMMRPRD